VGKQIEVLEGEEGLCSIVTRDDVDIVINALVGFAGLRPTIKAIEHKKKIALANKETLVAGGGVVAEALKDHHVELVPIDSEHSAILQCLAGEKLENVERLILTASGGPFLHFRKEELAHVTVEAALNHPNWKMGNKITIDSATMMNKGLEVIEAHWLFKLPPEKIHVVIHPQSIIHSMVEFIDGSVKAQLGVPDMKIPIQYALTYPDRMFLKSERLDFARLKQLTFLEPDREKFRCLELAYGALDLGGIAPAILNAANEVAVEAFLNRKTAFHTIAELIERALDGHNTNGHPDVEDIVEADRKTRLAVRSMIETKGKV
jgi:1-deoxy-D-xylulose-5-phosphate reductoisomerase